MTPAEFAREIAIPTVEDFRADRTSRRWAYLSAIAVYHLRDHLGEALTTLTGDAKADRRAVEAAAAKVDDAVRGVLPGEAFNVVRAVANGSKHALTRSPHGVMFTAGSDWKRPSASVGNFQFGVSRFGDFTGGREIAHNGARLDLYQAVQATLSTFLALYPDHLDGCTFEP